MRQLQGLRFNPTQWLEVLQEEVILRQLRRELDAVVASSLRNPCYRLPIVSDLRGRNTHRKNIYTLTSFTCLLSGGETPYKYAVTCVRRSEVVMKARKTFFGRT